MVDLDLPSTSPSYNPASLEPRYILDTESWEVVKCLPFLDASKSSRLARAFWIPESVVRMIDVYLKNPAIKEALSKKAWGDYCVLKARHLDSGNTIT